MTSVKKISDAKVSDNINNKVIKLSSALLRSKLYVFILKVIFRYKLIMNNSIDTNVLSNQIPKNILQKIICKIVLDNNRPKNELIIIELFNDYEYLYINYYTPNQDINHHCLTVDITKEEYKDFTNNKVKNRVENNWYLIQIPFITN